MFRKKTKIDNGKRKEERFKRIAGRRVQEILNKMRLLRNCSNKSNYSYTNEQVNKIFRAIDEEWKQVKSEYNKKRKNDKRFSL